MNHIIATLLISSLTLVWCQDVSKIVGGEDTNIEKYPHQISLQMFNQHFCGGSIISKTFVITAAHCLNSIASIYSVRVGTSKKNSGGSVHQVKAYHNHPYFNQQSDGDCDISVVELAKSIEFTIRAKPIALPDNSEILPVGKIVSVTGWGAVNVSPSYPEQLQFVQIPIVDHEKCKRAFAQTGSKVTESMICAGLDDKSPCFGDSGGPLVVDGKLYGVVSWGPKKCGKPGLPAVFANVSYLRDFIRKYAGV